MSSKRSFDATRELWEARASAASVLPTPSPSKKPAKTPVRTTEYSTVRELSSGNESQNTDHIEVSQTIEITIAPEDFNEKNGTAKELFVSADEMEDHSVCSDDDSVVCGKGISHMDTSITEDKSINTDDESDAEESESEREASMRSPSNLDSLYDQSTKSPLGQVDVPTEESLHSTFDNSENTFGNSVQKKSNDLGASNSSDEFEQNEDLIGLNARSVCKPTEAEEVSQNLHEESPLCSPHEIITTPKLVFEEAENERVGDAVVKEDPRVALVKKEIADLEAEANYQQGVVIQIRRTVTASEKTSASALSMVQPRAEAERTVLIAARKRKGCLARACHMQTILDQMRENPSLIPAALRDSSYTARLTFKKIELAVAPQFVEELKSDTHAEFFVIIIFMMYEQVYATEVLRLDEFSQEGVLPVTNRIQFQNVQHQFLIESEAFLLRISTVDSCNEAKGSGHTPGLLKRLISALPKSGNKSSSDSSVRANANAKVMSLGSMEMTLRNYQQKTHKLTDGLIVQNFLVLLRTDIHLDLDITVPFAGFLTFHCFNDAGTDWLRRWCVLQGSTILFWRYPDDVEKEKTTSPLLRFDLQHCINSTVSRVSSQLCARPCCFGLTTDLPIFNTNTRPSSVSSREYEYFIAADSKDSLTMWMDKLNSILTALQNWQTPSASPSLV